MHDGGEVETSAKLLGSATNMTKRCMLFSAANSQRKQPSNTWNVWLIVSCRWCRCAGKHGVDEVEEPLDEKSESLPSDDRETFVVRTSVLVVVSLR